MLKRSHTRRAFLKVVPAAVATGVAAPVARAAERSPISKDTLACGETLSGVTFTDAEHDVMLPNVTANREHYESIRRISIDDAVEPDESTVLAAALAYERARGPLDRRPSLVTN
jgi:hypothetical protein